MNTDCSPTNHSPSHNSVKTIVELTLISRCLPTKHLQWIMAFITLDKTSKISLVQGSLFIMLCLGSIELDLVVNEPCYKGIFMPQLRRSWRSILVLGCVSVHPFARTVHARILKFHMWIPYGEIADTLFLSELSPFLELCRFEEIRIKSDACHILWAQHARVLKFHIILTTNHIILTTNKQNFFCSYDPSKIWAF